MKYCCTEGMTCASLRGASSTPEVDAVFFLWGERGKHFLFPGGVFFSFVEFWAARGKVFERVVFHVFRLLGSRWLFGGRGLKLLDVELSGPVSACKSNFTHCLLSK